MTNQPEKPDDISQEAWDAVDVPEMTDEEFANARPLKILQPDLLQVWKRGKGRPTINGQPKKHMGLRLAADVVDAVKGSGKGYNGRVEAILRDAMARSLL